MVGTALHCQTHTLALSRRGQQGAVIETAGGGSSSTHRLHCALLSGGAARTTYGAGLLLGLAELRAAAARGKVERAHGLSQVIHCGADVHKGKYLGVAAQ